MTNFLLWITAILLFFGPYVKHIIWCIEKADETGSAIALLITGIIIFPVGWLHGVSLVFGYTWI